MALASLRGYGLYQVELFPKIVEEGIDCFGEVYDTDEDTLENGFLEGEGDLYIRKEVTITTASGELRLTYV